MEHARRASEPRETPRALATTPPAGYLVRSPERGAWCPSYLRGGVQRFYWRATHASAAPSRILQFLCLCASVSLPGSFLYGPALPLLPAQERSSSSLLTLEGTLNQGRCCKKTCPNVREGVGSFFFLASLVSGIPVASLAPSLGV